MHRTATFKPVKPVGPIKNKPEQLVTSRGTWRVLDCQEHGKFREFTSHAKFMGRPLVSIASGFDPDTKKMAVARGVIAIGQRASGTIAIGQFVVGTIAIGQFAAGRAVAFGQFTAAPLAIGQFSIAIAAIAQMAFVGWGIFQAGAVLFAGLGQVIFNASKFLGL